MRNFTSQSGSFRTLTNVSECKVVIDRAPLNLIEVTQTFLLYWKWLNRSNQVKLQCMFFLVRKMVIVMLQKLFLCFNNFYKVYVKCLDGLFGYNLQGMRLKNLDFKAQKWRFCEQFWFFLEYKGFWGLVNLSPLSFFSFPLPLFFLLFSNAPSIYRQEVWWQDLIRFTNYGVKAWLDYKWEFMTFS